MEGGATAADRTLDGERIVGIVQTRRASGTVGRQEWTPALALQLQGVDPTDDNDTVAEAEEGGVGMMAVRW